ncbi:hypothetical protein ACCD01_31035, partial [Telluria sp. Tellsp99]
RQRACGGGQQQAGQGAPAAAVRWNECVHSVSVGFCRIVRIVSRLRNYEIAYRRHKKCGSRARHNGIGNKSISAIQSCEFD